jgi:threonine synthase
VASALAFADPGDLGDATLDALLRSNGGAVAVADDALLAAWRDLGRLGIFSEPSGAISLAGALELARAGNLDREDVLVLNVTGTGFKDFETLLANVQVPDRVAASFEEMEREAREFDAERS